MATNIVDWMNPDANMYGCVKCPECGSEYRSCWTNDDGSKRIECSHCDFVEQATVVAHDLP